MKRKILAVILAVLTLGAVLVSCGGGAQMRMGTGGTGGTYYAFGGVLSQYIKNNAGINCVAVSTDGSKANIQGRFRRLSARNSPVGRHGLRLGRHEYLR